MIYTNPIYGFFNTLRLFITGRVQFVEQDVGKTMKILICQFQARCGVCRISNSRYYQQNALKVGGHLLERGDVSKVIEILVTIHLLPLD